MNTLIPLFVIVPLGVAFLIAIISRILPGFHYAVTPAGLIVLFSLALWFLLSAPAGPLVYKVGGWEPIAGIPVGIHLVIDGFSLLLLLIINLLGCLVAIYAIPYLEKFTGISYFYILLNLMIAGMNGVVITGDLFNLFVFLEISVIASYALVAFGTEKEELEASFKYQVLGGIASLFILFGIGMIYWYAKSLNMADIGQYIRANNNNPVIRFTEILMIAGFGLKAAIVPFHAWLPDAHSSAPSPISAMLSGVFIKAIGVYAILRIFFCMFPVSQQVSVAITVIGVLSMVAGVFLAIGQWDLKRLLAYHSISQMGYVIMSAGIGMMILTTTGNIGLASLAIGGALFHLLNHATFKGLLFLNAGAIEYRLHTRNLKEMGGLSGSMPITSATSFGASMAISGIPPFNGFFSKLVIIVAAVRAGYTALAVLAVLVSIITLASFLKFQRYAFQGKKRENLPEKLETPFGMCFSMVTLGVLCILLSLLIIPGLWDIILTPAIRSLLGVTGTVLTAN